MPIPNYCLFLSCLSSFLSASVLSSLHLFYRSPLSLRLLLFRNVALPHRLVGTVKEGIFEKCLIFKVSQIKNGQIECCLNLKCLIKKSNIKAIKMKSLKTSKFIYGKSPTLSNCLIE